jgi:hypothetical protein
MNFSNKDLVTKSVNIFLAFVASIMLPCDAQQIINGSRTLLGNWDASGAATTKPLKAGTLIPASCGVGEMFFKTDAAAGANLYLCTTVNNWTQIQVTGALASVFGRTGVVAAQTGDYNFSQVSGVAGTAQLPAAIQYFQAGVAAPVGACVAGQNTYLDTTNLDYWFCDVANTWKKVISTTNSGPLALTGQTGTSPATPGNGMETIYLNSIDKTLHTMSDTGADMRYAGLSESNQWGAFLQDFTASTMLIPVATGFTANRNGAIGYDSAANQLHAGINASDAIIATRNSSIPASGNCVKWGPNGQLQDQGSACGGGGSGMVNPGTANQVAYYPASSNVVAGLTCSSGILKGGTPPVCSAVATTDLPSAELIRTCEVAIGDPGSGSPVLVNDNNSPAVCGNKTSATMIITAVECYANAGSPTVNPIITGGSTTSILSSALTCGIGSFAPGTLNGAPTETSGQSIDANISVAGGTAKYIVIRITRTL